MSYIGYTDRRGVLGDGLPCGNYTTSKPFLGNIWIVTLDEEEKHVSRQHKVESAREVLSVFVST